MLLFIFIKIYIIICAQNILILQYLANDATVNYMCYQMILEYIILKQQTIFDQNFPQLCKMQNRKCLKGKKSLSRKINYSMQSGPCLHHH